MTAQNPASRTLFLKPLIPGATQLRHNEDCSSPMLRIYFTEKEAHELLGVGLRWRHYDCSPEMTKKCLEGSGFASEDHDVWFNFTSKTQKRHKAHTKVRVTVEKERDGVLRFRLSAEVQGGFRREDGQPAQVVIKRDETIFEEARVESIALDAGLEAYLLARKAEYRQCPWITTGLRELLFQLFDTLEVETEVFVQDEKADEKAPRKSRFEMVPRDPLEQQAQMDVLREVLSILPKVEVVGGLAPRIAYLKSMVDGLKEFDKELQAKIDAERSARRPKRQQGRQTKADPVSALMRSFGFDPKDAETNDEGAPTEPTKSEAAPVKPQPAATPTPTKSSKSFKAMMAEKAKKDAVAQTPRTIEAQMQKLVVAIQATTPEPVATPEPVPPVATPEPSEPASTES